MIGINCQYPSSLVRLFFNFCIKMASKCIFWQYLAWNISRIFPHFKGNILVKFFLIYLCKNHTIGTGRLISKANCQAMNSFKKWMNEFIFTTIRRVFVRFLEEIEDSRKTFWNYLTFITTKKHKLSISLKISNSQK